MKKDRLSGMSVSEKVIYIKRWGKTSMNSKMEKRGTQKVTIDM